MLFNSALYGVAAGRHLVLHLPVDELHHRRLPRQLAGAPLRSPLLLFVSFFPQLVAGPIVRARDLLPQLDARPPLTAAWAGAGSDAHRARAQKKVAIADPLAINLVDRVFETPTCTRPSKCSAASTGWSRGPDLLRLLRLLDIAIGTALLLGYGSVNFDAPYLSPTSRVLAAVAHLAVDAGCATTSTSRSAATATARG
jgi:hypothetical protein